MISKGEQFRLLKRGYPSNSDLWFGTKEAALFENEVFNSREDAHKAMLQLCESNDTLYDPNFELYSPIVLTQGEYFSEMDGDDSFNWY
ncbi:conserved hypothetical protein [Vibrio chagasii]|nr:conserved hypothetical protein [Vibrio chagasii]